MKVKSIILATLLLILSIGCAKDCQTPECIEKCIVFLEIVPCFDVNSIGFQFDKKLGKCTQMSDCGYAPFKTLKECEACGCK
jgi:hypothetical protein